MDEGYANWRIMESGVCGFFPGVFMKEAGWHTSAIDACIRACFI